MTPSGVDRLRCPDCAAGHEHCHGTLVVHPDGAVECVGSVSCDEVAERHPLVVECRELDPRCGCAEQPAATTRYG